MTQPEFVALRERCFNLVKEGLKKNYDGMQLDDFITLDARHRTLPAAPLVVETYQGIIGYRSWLEENGREAKSFVQDALHDLSECRQYARDDGYSPRTSSFVKFFKPKK